MSFAVRIGILRPMSPRSIPAAFAMLFLLGCWDSHPDDQDAAVAADAAALRTDTGPGPDLGVDMGSDAPDLGPDPEVIEQDFVGTVVPGCDWHFQLGPADGTFPRCDGSGGTRLSLVLIGSGVEVAPGRFRVTDTGEPPSVRMRLCADDGSCTGAISGWLEVEAFDRDEVAELSFQADFEDGTRVCGRAEVRDWCDFHVDCI